MKKLVYVFLFCLIFMTSAAAEKFPPMKHKNISVNDRIAYDQNTDIWSKKITKNDIYYIKTKGFGDYFDYLDSDKNFAFSTGCEYEFIYNDSLIGYSNRDLKFYYISYLNGGVGKRALDKEEVQALFPEYTVIALSEFNEHTNSYKLKKHIGNLKIFLLNDTDKTFDNYEFSSGNAVFEQYALRGFISISKKGMIQFANASDSVYNCPWYILLVR